jgi:hypothetical protein
LQGAGFDARPLLASSYGVFDFTVTDPTPTPLPSSLVILLIGIPSLFLASFWHQDCPYHSHMTAMPTRVNNSKFRQFSR